MSCSTPWLCELSRVESDHAHTLQLPCVGTPRWSYSVSSLGLSADSILVLDFMLRVRQYWNHETLCVSANGLRGKLGKPVYLEKWVTTKTSLTAGETKLDVEFEWDESMGVPGAFMIKNNHHSQFYLGTLTLEDVPGHGRLQFVCNSWVYPAHRYNHHRVFFSNKVTSSSYPNVICCPVVE